MNKHAFSIAAIIVAALSVAATENVGTSGKVAIGYKEIAASCNPASAQIDLDINNVRATLLNGGDMWWDLNDARYEIPKIDPPGSAPSVNALFAGAIWMGGIDAGNQLKIAAQTYRQNGNDFWPGPLDESGSIENADCEEYNRFWKVNATSIDSMRALFDACGGCELSEGDIAQSILEWPAKGNNDAKGALGNFLAINDELAPFFDYDGDGLYNPRLGDYPILNSDCDNVYADQMIFWVYNDRGNIHTETGGQPIGIQVNALAFAFATSDEVNDMTFYRYKLINKGNIDINNFYMAQWVDADLGCFLNDYVGCDTTRDLGICYNGTAVDADCATRGYGANPPMVGIDFFEGPLSDPDTTPAHTRHQLGMAAFTYYNNDQSVTGNPESAVQYYNYMTSKWKDNTCFTSDECTGYGGSVCADFMFPANPPQSPFPDFWSECACNNTPADRRFLQSSGPFTLEPGAVNNITVGAVWVRPQVGNRCPDFEATIGPASDKAQALFDNCFRLVNGPDAPNLEIRELNREIIISLINAPGSNNISESYAETDPVARAWWETHPDATDTTYTFEGYMIYQLKNAQVSVQELSDVSKARLVSQVDVKNGIDKLINFTFDANLGADVPELKVDGNNEGIRRTFNITEDLFATGSKTLVNHKNYYFAVVAYAYNNYRDYNPLRAFEGGQKTPYLQGRRNYRVYSGIPHMWESPRGGTDLTAAYGDGVKITRRDGKGNGGMNLELTEASVNNIMDPANNGVYGPVEYLENKGPLDVRVYDPMKLRSAFFEFTMDSVVLDTVVTARLSRKDTTYLIAPETEWRLEITNENGDYTLIRGDRNIELANEQLIRDYGISIRLNQVSLAGKAPNVVGTFDGYIPANGFMEGTMEFTDKENRWLTGVPDQGTFGPQNWIRAGQYTGGNNDQFEEFFDDHKFEGTCDTCTRQEVLFYDPQSVFGNVLGATWTPYALGANWVSRSPTLLALFRQSGINGGRPYSYGPAFPWRYRLLYTQPNVFQITENTLDNTQSVDVVLTSDKSKWTQCVVVELGEDRTLTEGNARKGQIRQHGSWLDYTSTNYSDTDTGRSWFPGYAINVESGERLNMMFGEDSWLIGEHGRDMFWNPTSNVFNPVPGSEPLFGGKHYIYVMNTRYDEGKKMQRDMLNLFDKFKYITGDSTTQNAFVQTPLNDTLYKHIMWVSTSLLSPGYKFTSLDAGLIPTETKVRLRVNAPYAPFVADGSNGGAPKYTWSTDGIETEINVVDTAKSACDMIRAVPNPYYAYSAYETSQLDNRVKITNLPDNCTVTIYTVNGTIIRRFNRAVSSDVSDGAPTDFINLDNSLDWDLKNSKDIPVASGLYLIHIEAPGVCDKVVKWFGVLRPIDLDTF